MSDEKKGKKAPKVNMVYEKSLHPYAIGDWIMADHPEYDLLVGFVESVDPYMRRCAVNITSADDERVIKSGKVLGNTIYIYYTDIKYKLDNADEVYYEEGYILNMIDFALLMRDEELFREMSDKLIALRGTKAHAAQNQKA